MPETEAGPPSLHTLADACQETLRYTFRDPELLHQALGILMPPLTPEQAAARQRLEFLGDAAWNFAVADTAFHLWPDAGAGDLTRLRATWSSKSGMARLARQLALPLPDGSGAPASAGSPEPQEIAASEPSDLPAPEALLESEETTSSLPAPAGPEDAKTVSAPAAASSEGDASEPPRPISRTDLPPPLAGPSERVVAELFEAILGAMVMDGGFDPVRELARRVIAHAGGPASPPPMDPKSALQILAQSRFGTLPAYRLLERHGPPHHPTFRVEATVRGDAGNIAASAEGTSRQGAEREAARRVLDMLSG